MKCGENRPDVEYVLSLSYGKDSIATIEACHQLGQRIDRIVHAEVWATQDIPAELPPMVEFKEKADKIIFERYGLTVDRVCAMKKNVRVSQDLVSGGINIPMKMHSICQSSTNEQSTNPSTICMDSQCNEVLGARNSSMVDGSSKKTYEDVFYRMFKKKGSYRENKIYGFPITHCNWCTSELKTAAIKRGGVFP